MLVVAALTVVSGLTIALYTGAEISIVQSRSLWHQPASPLLWFITAFLGAVGFKRQSSHIGGCAFAEASNGIEWSIGDSIVTYLGILKRLFLMALLLLTSVVLALFALREQNRGLWPTTLLALITLASSWTVRWVTMMDVQTIAKFDVGPFPYQLPLGSNGWLGIIGMYGTAGEKTRDIHHGNSLEPEYTVNQQGNLIPNPNIDNRNDEILRIAGNPYHPLSHQQHIPFATPVKQVEGLKQIRDLATPVDPQNPEYGPKANQLLMTNAGNEGRDDIFKRFAFNSFYNAFTIMMLNALVGNINMKGGAMAKAGGYPTSAAGPRYDFTQFAGKVGPKGVFLSRSKKRN